MIALNTVWHSYCSIIFNNSQNQITYMDIKFTKEVNLASGRQ